jgi:hypothetical protein
MTDREKAAFLHGIAFAGAAQQLYDATAFALNFPIDGDLFDLMEDEINETLDAASFDWSAVPTRERGQ